MTRDPETRRLVRWTIVLAIANIALVLCTLLSAYLSRHDQRELLQAQTAAELDREFDSAEMRRSRRTLATLMLNNRPISDYRVLDFFEKVGEYRRKHRVDDESIFSSFSWYAERYWSASKGLIVDFRNNHQDNDFYSNFEDLNIAMLASDNGKGLPVDAPAIKEFLEDESKLDK